ncbi:MAG: CpsB/CapC family capsule biosynthesis tyrosine phosphatase [Planctomycetota bacterium]
MSSFVDIHCHLLPGIDDGAADLAASLAMARLQVASGVSHVVVTPHQLGAFAHNEGDAIRTATTALQAEFDKQEIPLRVSPGADVRIEDGMMEKLDSGEVLSLGDHQRHVLLELPHELYFPLEPVLDGLAQRGMVGVLSHPERNAGLLKEPSLIEPLVEAGCLMQVTAGSLLGAFGSSSQAMAESMAKAGLIHFLATDAHSPRRRKPALGEAMTRAADLVGEPAARLWCDDYPAAVAAGQDVPAGRVRVTPPRRGWSLWRRSA